MQQYLDLVRHCLGNGSGKIARTRAGTLATSNCEKRWDFSDGCPCLTTKILNPRSIIRDLWWFLKVATNTTYLQEKKVAIWNEWPEGTGYLGPVNDKQWRSRETHCGRTIDLINYDRDSRRIIFNAWKRSGSRLSPITLLASYSRLSKKAKPATAFRRWKTRWPAPSTASSTGSRPTSRPSLAAVG